MAGDLGVLGVDGEDLSGVAQLVQVLNDLEAGAGLLRGADDGDGLGAEQGLQRVPRVADGGWVRPLFFLPVCEFRVRGGGCYCVFDIMRPALVCA